MSNYRGSTPLRYANITDNGAAATSSIKYAWAGAPAQTVESLIAWTLNDYTDGDITYDSVSKKFVFNADAVYLVAVTLQISTNGVGGYTRFDGLFDNSSTPEEPTGAFIMLRNMPTASSQNTMLSTTTVIRVSATDKFYLGHASSDTAFLGEDGQQKGSRIVFTKLA